MLNQVHHRVEVARLHHGRAEDDAGQRGQQVDMAAGRVTPPTVATRSSPASPAMALATM